MALNPEELTVVRNDSAKRYEIKHDGKIAFAEYMESPGRLIFTHTEVPVEWEGQGIGSKLVREALDDVRARGLQVMPLCPFVKAYVARHKAYHDIAFGFGAKPLT